MEKHAPPVLIYFEMLFNNVNSVQEYIEKQKYDSVSRKIYIYNAKNDSLTTFGDSLN